jgi:5'-nucleotidase
MILLVNDDGIDAPGLRALYAALRKRVGRPVLAVAPLHERSGQAHAITLDRGLAVVARHEPGFFGFTVDGTPTDCLKLALTTLMPEPPELVVSGVNDGPNVGRSIFYSGTLGAAIEAAVEGHAALAVSRVRGEGGFADAAECAAGWAARMLGRGDFRRQVVNLNLPATPMAQWRETRIAAHGHAGFHETYRPQRDAKDRVVWKLHGRWTAKAGADHSDASLLTAGHPVLTLLRPDLNAPERPLRRLVDMREGA